MDRNGGGRKFESEFERLLKSYCEAIEVFVPAFKGLVKDFSRSSRCSSLATIYVPDSVTQIGDNSFDEVNEEVYSDVQLRVLCKKQCTKKKFKYQLV